MRKYDRCRVCSRFLSGHLRASARRLFQQGICSAECSRKEQLRFYGCCEKAQACHCVCTFSTNCPDHGRICRGTHD
jgi:hypothetical protein